MTEVEAVVVGAGRGPSSRGRTSSWAEDGMPVEPGPRNLSTMEGAVTAAVAA